MAWSLVDWAHASPRWNCTLNVFSPCALHLRKGRVLGEVTMGAAKVGAYSLLNHICVHNATEFGASDDAFQKEVTPIGGLRIPEKAPPSVILSFSVVLTSLGLSLNTTIAGSTGGSCEEDCIWLMGHCCS